MEAPQASHKQLDRLMKDSRFLILMSGLPASGKTHFSQYLAANSNFERINSDEIGYKLFNKRYLYSRSEVEQIHQVLDEQTEIAIKTSDKSLIRDVMHLKSHDRQRLAAWAKQAKMRLVIVAIKTPILLVVWRNLKHKGLKGWGPTYKTMLRFKRQTQAPQADEPYLYLRGTVPVKKQYTALVNYLQLLVTQKDS